MVARNHDPEANANDSLGDDEGGNLDQPDTDASASTVDEKAAPEPKREEPKDTPKPAPSGPGLRTTNTPMRRR